MEQKRCGKCKEFKDLCEFGKCSCNKDGLQYICKTCRKKYREENKEKIKEQKKLYYKKNKEKINKKSNEYCKKNKKLISKTQKKYRENNKETILKKKKQYYQRHKEIISEKGKEYRNNNKKQISKRNKQYNISNAKYESFYYKLTTDEAPKLSSDRVSLEVKCRYCGRYYVPNNAAVRRRIQALNGTLVGEHSLYCSEGCKKACPIYGKIVYPKGFKKISSREVNPLVRQMCFERDGWKCQICGAGIEATLHCHHIEGYTQNPRLGNDVGNTITLCKECHKEVHRLPGCNYYELRCNTED